MKVATSNPEFRPITIVLETEGEAYAMYHRLNISYEAVKAASHSAELGKLKYPAQPMWDAFSKVYRPSSNVD